MLAGLEAFVFDLDGCVWNGDALNPGAGETLAALVRHPAVNSTFTGDAIQRHPAAHVGIAVAAPTGSSSR